MSLSIGDARAEAMLLDRGRGKRSTLIIMKAIYLRIQILSFIYLWKIISRAVDVQTHTCARMYTHNEIVCLNVYIPDHF